MRKSNLPGGAQPPAERARLVVEYRDPRALKRYDRNARTHSPEQVRAIRASMDRFGNNAPILLRDDETTIGAGHGRCEAALLEPAYSEVPTITLRGLTDAEWRAYVIADNKLHEMGGWDEELLASEVAEILADDQDLDALLGFATADLDALLGAAVTAPAAGPTFSYQEQFGVVVMCAGETEQQQIFERLTGEGLDCRVVVT